MAPPNASQLQFALIGCGLIGHKRATALPPGRLRWVCDLNLDRAEKLASIHPGCRASNNSEHAFEDPAVNAVIISTINGALAPVALAAVHAGKHVLLEKPGALNAAQLRAIQQTANATGTLVRLGYNHRFHPALQKARALIDENTLGPLMFMRGRYGHGGRPGYDREWRADPKLSGGGELIDQGVHLIDLAGWFFGEFTTIEGHATTSYWDMPVDDNAFLSLRTQAGQTAWLHVSCSEWKNLFSIEIYGRDGKISLDGLGGSYGPERCTYYKMLPEMGPPEITTWQYPPGDTSWALEIATFEDDIRLNRPPRPGLPEAIRTLEIVELIYAQSSYLVNTVQIP